MRLLSRKEAIAKNIKYYFTGKPCKRGHLSERNVTDRQCCVCNSEFRRSASRREYMYQYGRGEHKKVYMKQYEKSEVGKDVVRRYRDTSKGIVSKLFRSAKARAKRKNLEFSLTRDDIKIPETCPILGILLRRDKNIKGPSPSAPSLDRIDSEKGYTKDNVEVISHRANTLKSNGTLEEFKLIIKYLENI